jgi:hypothetical protein
MFGFIVLKAKEAIWKIPLGYSMRHIYANANVIFKPFQQDTRQKKCKS